jgi:lipid-A-disaccharide synthase
VTIFPLEETMKPTEPTHRDRSPLRILMAAGEVSGDLQGGLLARALSAQLPELRIIGVGGPRMRAAGVALETETIHLSTVGFLEPLRHAWATQEIFSKLRRLIREEPPDLAIRSDNAGFNYALARYLRRLGIPVIDYFPPQAWVASRFFAGAVGRVTRLIISAFPGEAEIYRRHGARVVCLGHPLVDIL